MAAVAVVVVVVAMAAMASAFQVPFVVTPGGNAVAYMPASHTNACPSPLYVTRIVGAGNVTRPNTQALRTAWVDLIPLDAVIATCPDPSLCSSAAVVPTQFLCGLTEYVLVYDVLWCALPHTLATFPRAAWPDVVQGATVDGFEDENLYSYDSGFRTHVLPGYNWLESTCSLLRFTLPVDPEGPAVAFQRLLPPPDDDAVGLEAPFRWSNDTFPVRLHGVWTHLNATTDEEVSAVQNASALAEAADTSLGDVGAFWDPGSRTDWPTHRIPTAASLSVSLTSSTPVQHLVFGPGTPARVAVAACAQHEDCVGVLVLQNGTGGVWTTAAVSALALNTSSSSNGDTYALLSMCSLGNHSYPTGSPSPATHTDYCPRVTNDGDATTTTCVSPLQIDAWATEAATTTAASCACRPEWAQPNVLVPVPGFSYVRSVERAQTCVSCAAPLFLESISVGMDSVPSLVLTPTGETHVCIDPDDPAYVNPCGQWGVVDTSSHARQNPLDYTCVCFGVYSYSPTTRTCECADDVCGDSGTCQTTNVTTVPGCVCDPGYGNADHADATSPCTVCDTGFVDIHGNCEAVEDACPGPFLSSVATQIQGVCVYILPDLETDACFVEDGVVGNDGGRPCFNARVWCGEDVDEDASIAAGHCVCDNDDTVPGRGDCRPCSVTPDEGCDGGAVCGAVHFATPHTGGCECIDTCETCVSEDYEHTGSACFLRAARTHADCGGLGTVVPGLEEGTAAVDTAWTCACHSNSNKSASAVATFGSQAPCDTCQDGAVAPPNATETEECVPCSRPCLHGTGPCQLDSDNNQVCPGCQAVLGRLPRPVPWATGDGDACGACLPGYADTGNGSMAVCVPCPGADDATRERDAAVCSCSLLQGSQHAAWTPGPGWARNPTTEECNVCAPGFSGEDCVACHPECPPGVPCAWSGNATYCACSVGFRLPPTGDDDGVCGPCVHTHLLGDDGACSACPRTTCDWAHSTCTPEGCACDPGYTGDDCDACSPGFVDVGGGNCVACPSTCPLPVCSVAPPGDTATIVCDCAAAGRVQSGNATCGPCQRGLQQSGGAVCDIECPGRCSGVGDCVVGAGGNATCVCDAGFVGSDCGACDTPAYVRADGSDACLLCPTHCDYDAPCVQRSPTQAGCDCAAVHRVDGPTLSLCGVACDPPWSGRACDVPPSDSSAEVADSATVTTLGCPLSCGDGGTCLPEWHCACSLGNANHATGTVNETCVPCPPGNASVVNPVTCVVCGCTGAMLCGHDGVCRVGGVFVPPPATPARLDVNDGADTTIDTMRDVKSVTLTALALGLPALLVLFGGGWGVTHAVSWCVRLGEKKRHTE